MKKSLVIFIFSFLSVFIFSKCVYAAVWSYKINSGESVVDLSKTSAVVDTTNHVIKLPKTAPKVISFEGENFDYLVLTPTEVKRYSWTGSSLNENTVIKVSGLSNPISAYTSVPYPDVVVATSTAVTHYTFSGSMIPAWSVSGLTGVISISSRSSDFAVLGGSQLKYYGYTGSGASNIAALSITFGLNNPIDFALNPSTYDCVVLEPDKARYFAWTGSSLAEVTALNITGISAPKSVSMGTENNIAIIEGNKVNVYTLSGSSFTYNAALSVTSGLTNPTSVAVRPGSNDLLIVDGDNVKYYMFNGTSMVYNSTLSKSVSGVSNIGAYASSAVVVSNVNSAGSNVTKARIRAYCTLQNNTSITFQISTNGGTTWENAIRASKNASGIVTIELGTGSSWASSSLTLSDITPVSTNISLWRTFASGSNIAWKITLATSDSTVTPQIVAPNPGVDNAIVWDTNVPPNPPTISVPGGGVCYTISNPTISWIFSDSDVGDSQSAYQVTITPQGSSTVLINTGKVSSSSTSYNISDSNANTLFNSGYYQFTVSVTVWDQADSSSSPASADFCIVAFTYPRIREIVSPPAGQVKPDPSNPSTYIPITKGMVESALPKTKAGGKVGLLLNGIGIGTCNASFTYSSKTANTNPPSVYQSVGSSNKVWLLEFWTSPDLADCPSGTRVDGNITGTGAGNNTQFIMQKGAAGTWSEGVVTTSGTVLEDWFVILEGRS